MGNDTAFSNKDIVAPRKNKPHIVLIRGYWRVSPAPRPFSTETILWQDAHAWVESRNVLRRNEFMDRNRPVGLTITEAAARESVKRMRELLGRWES